MHCMSLEQLNTIPSNSQEFNNTLNFFSHISVLIVNFVHGQCIYARRVIINCMSLRNRRRLDIILSNSQELDNTLNFFSHISILLFRL